MTMCTVAITRTTQSIDILAGTRVQSLTTLMTGKSSLVAVQEMTLVQNVRKVSPRKPGVNIILSFSIPAML